MVTLNLESVRTITLGLVTGLSVPFIALGGYACSKSKLQGFAFPILAIVAGVLLFLTLPTLYILQRTRPKVMTNWTVFQFAWISVLCIKPLISAILALSYLNIPDPSEGYADEYYKIYDTYHIPDDIPTIVTALMAIGFTIWGLLLVSNAFLVVLAIKAYCRGNRGILTQPVSTMTATTEHHNEKGGETSTSFPPHASYATL